MWAAVDPWRTMESGFNLEWLLIEQLFRGWPVMFLTGEGTKHTQTFLTCVFQWLQ
jgi:hypothetical protein